jgi:hypothetical protein
MPTILDVPIKVSFQQSEINFLKAVSEKYFIEPGSIIKSGMDICGALLTARDKYKQDKIEGEPVLVIVTGNGSPVKLPDVINEIKLSSDFPVNCLPDKKLVSDQVLNINLSNERKKELDEIVKKASEAISPSDAIRACVRLFGWMIVAKKYSNGTLGVTIKDQLKDKFIMDITPKRMETDTDPIDTAISVLEETVH